MIRNIFFVIFLIFISYNSSVCQDVFLKFYGGTNFYYPRGSQILLNGGEEIVYGPKDGKPDVFLGYGIEYFLNQKIVISADIEFSKRREDRSKRRDRKFFRKYHYASIRPSIGYNLMKNFSLKGGIQFDHLLKKQPISYFDFDLEELSFRSYDLGLTFDMRYKISKIEIFGGYFHGLPYIVFRDDPATMSSLFVKSRMFKFGVGYLIN